MSTLMKDEIHTVGKYGAGQFENSILSYSDYMSVKWTGFIVPVAGAGTYYIKGKVDDYFKVTIGGEEVVTKKCCGESGWGAYEFTSDSPQPVEILFKEGYGGAYLQLSWKGPDFDERDMVATDFASRLYSR